MNNLKSIIGIVQHIDLVPSPVSPVEVTLRYEADSKYFTLPFTLKQVYRAMELADIGKVSELIGKRVEITGYEEKEISWKNLE